MSVLFSKTEDYGMELGILQQAVAPSWHPFDQLEEDLIAGRKKKTEEEADDDDDDEDEEKDDI